MTTSPSSTISAERDRIRSLVVPTGIVTVLVSSVFTYLGAHTWQESASMIALASVVAVGVYGFLAPRALDRPAAPGLAVAMSAIAAVITLPGFWTGLPLVLGAAGALLGFAGRGSAKGSGLSIAAMLLGLLTVIAYLTIYIVDGLVFGNSI